MGPSDGSRARIPPLKDPDSQQTVINNADKSRVLCETFFPHPTPSSDSEHTAHLNATSYPLPAFILQPKTITDNIVSAAITRLKEYKAPGPDGIPNEIYKWGANALTPYLARIFRATVRLKVYPDVWKISKMVVLQKPGCPDYGQTKVYRPIALMNCLGKILSSCVANILVYQAEKHALIAPNHFGRRPGRTTTDSLHLFVKKIQDAWRRGHKAAALFLDIKAAFPSAVPGQLLENMKMKGVPHSLTD